MTAIEEEMIRLWREAAQDPEAIAIIGDVSWSGNITVRFAGWTFVVFIDANEVDYVDCAIGPSGQFWVMDVNATRQTYPLDMLTPRELAALSQRLRCNS